MKGEIFRALEAFIEVMWGDGAYEVIHADVERELVTKKPFVGPGTYPDSDLMALIGATVARSRLSPAEAVRAFGKFLFTRLAARIPQHVARYKSPQALLQTLDSMIHLEVRKVMPGAEPPKFECEVGEEGRVVLTYRSRRKLYALVEGLLEGLAEHMAYELKVEKVEVTSPQEGECKYYLHFSPK